jgi:hypothetical protein
LVFPWQYRSTIAPYPFIHLPPTLYHVFLPVLQFSRQYHFNIAPLVILICMKPGNFPKSNALRETCEHCTDTYFNVLFIPLLQSILTNAAQPQPGAMQHRLQSVNYKHFQIKDPGQYDFKELLPTDSRLSRNVTCITMSLPLVVRGNS